MAKQAKQPKPVSLSRSASGSEWIRIAENTLLENAMLNTKLRAVIPKFDPCLSIFGKLKIIHFLFLTQASQRKLCPFEE